MQDNIPNTEPLKPGAIYTDGKHRWVVLITYPEEVLIDWYDKPKGWKNGGYSHTISYKTFRQNYRRLNTLAHKEN